MVCLYFVIFKFFVNFVDHTITLMCACLGAGKSKSSFQSSPFLPVLEMASKLSVLVGTPKPTKGILSTQSCLYLDLISLMHFVFQLLPGWIIVELQTRLICMMYAEDHGMNFFLLSLKMRSMKSFVNIVRVNFCLLG